MPDRKARLSWPKATHRRRGKGCAQNMVQQNQTTFARARGSSMNEITRSFAACSSTRSSPRTDQEPVLLLPQQMSAPAEGAERARLRRLVTRRRGFGEGAPTRLLVPHHLGLCARAESKGMRASDLSWIPDEGYRSSQTSPTGSASTRSYARSSRPPEPTRATVSARGGPSTGSARRPPRSSRTGSDAT